MQSESHLSPERLDPSTSCPFCQYSCVADYTLQETTNFRIIADHAPVVEGHLLIIPRHHYACYGAVPEALDSEFQALKSEIRAFFSAYYASPIFWEHGVFRQTVFHAHLHCFPIGTLTYDPQERLHEQVLRSQEDLRNWYTNQGHYFYLEDQQDAYLFMPDLERYHLVAYRILRSGAAMYNKDHIWLPAQQRRERGKEFVTRTQEKWQSFHQK